MPDSRKVSGAEIVDQLGEDAVRKAFRLMGLVDSLRNSIINDSYTPSEQLSESIKLTAKGHSVARRLSLDTPSHAKSNTKRTAAPRFTREAQLMCLLELGNGEPLIDLDDIDIEAVRAAISAEFTRGAVRHPYIFGSSLYRKAADLFPDLLEQLSHQQTMDLLEGTEQGVFQTNEWLSGPKGIYSVREQRLTPPIIRVPLQHCNDISCPTVHTTWLRTSQLAPINARRELIQSYLAKESTEWEWFDAFRSVTSDDPRAFQDDVHSGVMPLVGDGLSLVEKRELLLRLIEANQDAFRVAKNPPREIRDAAAYVNSLSEAECLQEVLWFRDSEIADALDELVLMAPARLKIPPGEIRRGVLVKNHGYGYFRTRTELSRHGTRVAGSRDLAPLRLDRAIKELYRGEEGSDEISWKLRRFEGFDVSAKVHEALRRGELLDLIDSLMVDSRKHALATCDLIGLSSQHVTRANVSELVAWKLGFDVPLRGDVFALFEEESRRFHDIIASQTDAFVIGESEDADSDQMHSIRGSRGIREAASSYFVTLEMVLREVVSFATWSLVADHFQEPNAFQYDSDRAFVFAAQTLNPGLPGAMILDPEKATIAPLIEAIGALERLLCAAQSSQVGEEIKEEFVPEVAAKGSLIEFPFRTNAMFDALSNESREGIIGTLHKAHNMLAASGIASLRNSQLHYRPNSVESGKIGKTVGDVLEILRSLDTAGFVPALSSLTEVKSGRWGRRVFVHTVAKRRTVELYSPTAVFSGFMPSMRSDQLIIPHARLEGDGLPLRFELRSPSQFIEMWKGIPDRRRGSVGDATSPEDVMGGQSV